MRGWNAMPGVATLRDALQAEGVQSLKQTLKVLPTKERPTRKADLVALVAAHLTGDELRARWQALEPLEQAAVAEAVYAPHGIFNARQFLARYGSIPAFRRDHRRYGSLPRLAGLFFFRSAGSLVVPQDLAQELRAFVAEPPPPVLETIDPLPARVGGEADHPALAAGPGGPPEHQSLALTCRETEADALGDLATVLRWVAQGRVAVSPKTPRPTAATVRGLSEVLSGGDFYPAETPKDRWHQVIGSIKPFAWPLLLQAGRLAERHGNRLALTRAGQAALSRPAPETLRRLWEAWLKSKLLDEFNRVDVIKGQTGRGKRGLTDPSMRRFTIAEALEHCPTIAWVSVKELARYMRANDLDFEVTNDPWSLYIGDAHYGNLGSNGAHGWELLQERYLRCLLFEYAATLGLVDVAYIDPRDAQADYRGLWGVDDLAFLSRYDGLLALRLTELGAYCLGLTEDYQPRQRPLGLRLSVLPNLRVQVREGTPPPEAVVLLESWAEQESDTAWRLDPARALRTVESGRSTAELREFLEAGDDQPLPEPVEGFLAGAERRGRALRVSGPALLIDCADAELARHLATHAQTRDLCAPAGERQLVVRAEAEAAFRKAAHALGYGLASG